VVLGYLGFEPATPRNTAIAQVCTVIYFGFFLLMPWYSKLGTAKPVPERVTGYEK
ncbi:MAG: ubiquinol-cytochrome c reductase cytochrome b subunit, partial [Gammaproteobacteria bacterium]